MLVNVIYDQCCSMIVVSRKARHASAMAAAEGAVAEGEFLFYTKISVSRF